MLPFYDKAILAAFLVEVTVDPAILFQVDNDLLGAVGTNVGGLCELIEGLPGMLGEVVEHVDTVTVELLQLFLVHFPRLVVTHSFEAFTVEGQVLSIATEERPAIIGVIGGYGVDGLDLSL